MNQKKITTIAILNILKEYSDQDHIISQADLSDLLIDIYGISIDRRTLYSDINALIHFGYDISTYKDNKKGYFLKVRDFQSSEIFLLCNAIHATNFIPLKASKELIEELLNTQSKYYREEYNSRIFVENNAKKDNKELFLNIENIAEALKDKKAISFNYTKYDINKKLVNRKDDLYIYSPYHLVYSKDKIYMIAKSKKHEGLTHFRVDRMKNTKLLNNEEYIKLDRNEDPYTYAKNKIYMYSGDNKNIKIKCDMSILDDVIDIFGKGIVLNPINDKEFVACVSSNEEGMIYLALQYINHMEVLEPQSLRDKILESINEGYKKYK